MQYVNVSMYLSCHTENKEGVVVPSHISVRVSAHSPSIEDYGDNECYYRSSRYRFSTASSRTLVCTEILRGRYVSIRRMGGDYDQNMTLCEVIVWGHEEGQFGGLVRSN